MFKSFITLRNIATTFVGLFFIWAAMYELLVDWPRQKLWNEVEAYAEVYKTQHPEISNSELYAMTEDLYLEAKQKRGLK